MPICQYIYLPTRTTGDLPKNIHVSEWVKFPLQSESH
jgi:hypothetical protein